MEDLSLEEVVEHLSRGGSRLGRFHLLPNFIKAYGV